VRRFAKFLYESFDIDMSDSVDGKELIESLLSLGLAPDHEAIIRILR
jgi:hypothetical protein